MNWDFNSMDNMKHNTEMPTAVKLARRLSLMVEELGLVKSMDEQSNGQKVKKLLRCESTGCLDKHNICCKACDISNCRYKCDLMDEGTCEHEFI